MDSLQGLKSRLRAVKNIGQITKAMEVVSATKMRRAQEIALNSRPYAVKALRLLERISLSAPIATPFTQARPVEKTLVLIVSSDRGLAGSFNTKVFRTADSFFDSDKINPPAFSRGTEPREKNLKLPSIHTARPQGIREGEEINSAGEQNYFAVTVGKKAAAYALKKGLNIVKKFYEAGDYAIPEEIRPITNLLTDGFLKRKWDRVITISTHFRTTLKQEVLLRQVLPADFEKIRETAKEIIPEYGRWADVKAANGFAAEYGTEYIFEPSPAEALNALIPHLIEIQIYHLMLEANASEHSARMVAMKNASDNAEDLSGKLTLDYNKARQASITKEIIEITSAQSAMT